MSNKGNKVTTLVFDVDDTLYDVSTGFTAYRNGVAAHRFMMEFLNFADLESAKKLRDEYFGKYHATAKALQVAEKEGKLPPPDPNNPKQNKQPRFDPNDLAEYWATSLPFDLLGGEKKSLRKDLQECNLKMIAFSNGPRKYVIRVLDTLGLWQTVFNDDSLFAVDDVLPYCKPEKEAFDVIFDRIGAKPSECVMFEDSMKNIRRCKELGMKTVLISGKKDNAETSEATKPGDAPDRYDPAVDVAIETIEEMRSALAGLWKSEPVFEESQLRN